MILTLLWGGFVSHPHANNCLMRCLQQARSRRIFSAEIAGDLIEVEAEFF